jgi:hypothetical protein
LSRGRRALGPTLALAASLLAVQASAEVVEMLDGDRFRGKIVSKRKTSLVLKTAYGSLTIPRSRVAKIVHDDGREEVLNAPLAPAVVLPPPPPVRLVLIVTGDSFWYAWDPPKGTIVDPTLRLQVSVDEQPIVVYADSTLDPGDLPKAVVNSFSFEPQVVTPVAGNEARPLPPESRPGRAVLKIDLPPPTSGRRRLRFAYQINDGSPEAPAWRDCAEAALELELSDDAPNFVHLRQNRGRMEFSGFLHKKMKQVESFVVEARPERNVEEAVPPAP